jgi:hypothetical protein
MKRQHFAFEFLIYLSASVLVVFVGLLTPQFGFKTIDDTSLLPEYLTNYNQSTSSQVLGANDRNSSNQCPLDKPIVGWLSYRGDKVLPDKLPVGESPSVCFGSYEEAYQEGFVNE